jgi:hypothetical protein
MKSRTQDQGLADNRRLLRAWRAWHHEQLEEALAGPHGTVIARLMALLKGMTSARALVDFINAQDWSSIDAATRFTALHQINEAITAHRERNDLAPIDDALPAEPPNAFQTNLGDQIARFRTAYPDAVPVVALDAAAMPTRYGRKSKPILKVVGWKTANGATAEMKQLPAQTLAQEMGDEIPSDTTP